jgi:hypothetical protein
MRSRRLKKNTSEEMIAALPPGLAFTEVAGAPHMRYIATIINPVDHKIYDVVYDADDNEVCIVAPMPSEEYKDPRKTILSFGEGYLDSSSRIEISINGEESTLARSHTPAGVGAKGTGQGLLLYCGLALFAKTQFFEGIYSSMEQRSPEASKWWASQVRRGFAEKGVSSRIDTAPIHVYLDSQISNDDLPEMEDFYSEEMQILDIDPSYVEVVVTYEGMQEVQYLTASKVAEAGIVIAWDDTDDGLTAVLEEGRSQPIEVLLELDLSTTSDPIVVESLLTELENSQATSEQIQRFLSSVPERLLRGLGEETQDKYFNKGGKQLVANFSKHSKSWQKFFGSAVTSN